MAPSALELKVTTSLVTCHDSPSSLVIFTSVLSTTTTFLSCAPVFPSPLPPHSPHLRCRPPPPPLPPPPPNRAAALPNPGGGGRRRGSRRRTSASPRTPRTSF